MFNYKNEQGKQMHVNKYAFTYLCAVAAEVLWLSVYVELLYICMIL